MTRFIWRRWAWAAVTGAGLAQLAAADAPKYATPTRNAPTAPTVPAPMVVEGHRPNDVIVLQFPGKPDRKVSVLKSDRQPDGKVHTEVKDAASGETFTLIDDGKGADAPPPAKDTPAKPAAKPEKSAVTPASGSKGKDAVATADAPKRNWFGFGSKEPAPAAPATAREPVAVAPPAPEKAPKTGFLGRLFGKGKPTPPPAPTPPPQPAAKPPAAAPKLPSAMAPAQSPVPERMPAPLPFKGGAPVASPTPSAEPPFVAKPAVPEPLPVKVAPPVVATPLPTPVPTPTPVPIAPPVVTIPAPVPTPAPVIPPTPVIPVPVIPNPAVPVPVPQPGLPVTPPGGVSVPGLPAPLPGIPAPLPAVPAAPSTPGLPAIPAVPGQSAAPVYDPAVVPVAAFVTPQIRMADEMHGFVAALHSSPADAERAMAAKALAEGRYGSRAEVKALLFEAAKADPCPGVRAKCIGHLCRLGYFDPAFLGFLQTCLADAAPKEVRTAAADALVKMSPR